MNKSVKLLRICCYAILFLLIHSGCNKIYSQKPKNPVLLPGTYEIDSVTIKARIISVNPVAQPFTEPVSLMPVISKISRTDIHNQGAVSLVDAMNYIPGGFTETRGRQVKQFFSVRGQKYPYPDYAINGVWQKEFEELPYFFSASDIENIEVIRSSAALLTGLSGLSGLINVKTREYESLEMNLETEYGSFNTLHSHLSVGNKNKRFAYAAGAGYDRTDGPDGKHSHEEMASYYTRIDWQLSDKLSLNSGFYYLDGKREMRIAEPPAETRYRNMIQSFDPYTAVLSNIKMTYRPTGKLSSELQLFFSHRNPSFIDEVKETTSNEKDYEWGTNYIQSISISGSNVLRFGGLYSRWVAPNGKRFYIGKRCDTETLSAVVTDEQRLGPVIIDAGVRLTRTYLNDYGAFNIEGDGAQFKNVTPVEDEWEPLIAQGSLGVTFDITETMALFFNSAAGQVKPRQGALTVDMTEPVNETRLKLDLGVIKNIRDYGKITATAFGVLQKNAIALSGTIYADPETNITRELYLNRNQRQWGLEFDFTGSELFSFVRPFINFTLMKSTMEQKEENDMVVNRENPVFISGGGLYMNKRGFDLNLLGKYVSPFENDRFVPAADGPQPLGDFFVLDINGGYTTKWKAPVRFYLRIKNVTDKKYSTVNGYPDFGRMLFAGMQIKFLRTRE